MIEKDNVLTTTKVIGISNFVMHGNLFFYSVTESLQNCLYVHWYLLIYINVTNITLDWDLECFNTLQLAAGAIRLVISQGDSGC